jgi:hypothetical protein
MANWQQFVIMFEIITGGGYQYGRVVYPATMKGQDVNGVIDQYGQQGFEVAHLELQERCAVVVLKKPL